MGARGSDGIEWMSTDETAKFLGISSRTLYRFIDDGTLPAYRLGRVIRLQRTEVLEFIDSCRIVLGTLNVDSSR